jgi:superfamily II DNA/RNA helicase
VLACLMNMRCYHWQHWQPDPSEQLCTLFSLCASKQHARFSRRGRLLCIVASQRAKHTRFPHVVLTLQVAAIPHALAARDVLGAASTGSGKTLAFVIPLLERLHRNRYLPTLLLL